MTHPLLPPEPRDEHLKRLYRLASIGKLSAGLFHDLGNIVTSLSLSVTSLSRELADARRGGKSVGLALKAARRAERAMTNIEKYLRAKMVRAEFSLERELRDTLAMFAHEAKRAGVEMRLIVEEDIRLTHDPFLFSQVVANLLSNALEAYEGMPRGERAPVRVTLRRDKPGFRVCVEDAGTGIDPALGESVFDTFFTTKEHGIGLGLAHARDIAEREFGGTLSYASSPEGTTFVFAAPTRGIIKP